MTNEELEFLLNAGEGTALDFKREQYAFQGANNSDKSELLKDILAFANSWRENKAYILIGVDEVKGGRGKVVGITDHLDDADLQQFVNSKSQRPVDFSYNSFSVEDLEIGIIEIPLQERPTYLKRDFGKLKKDTVYIRRGSSTDTANLDEVARMGAESMRSNSIPQNLIFQWADLEKRIILPSPLTIHSLILEPRLRIRERTDSDGAFEHLSHSQDIFSYFQDLSQNSDFLQQSIDYTVESNFFTPLGLQLRNDSEVVGKSVRFVGSISRSESEGVEFLDSELEKPSKSNLRSSMMNFRSIHSREPYIRAYKNDGKWTIEIEVIENVRPKEEVWISTSTDMLLVGSGISKTIKIEGKIYAENLPIPISTVLEICFEIEQRPMEIADYEKIWG